MWQWRKLSPPQGERVPPGSLKVEGIARLDLFLVGAFLDK